MDMDLKQNIKVINGHKLNEPSEEIKDKHKIVNNNIKRYFDDIKEINIKHYKLI